MGEVSGIAWTDATFNPWWGCERVSPGCDNCYAEAWAKRTGHVAGGARLPVWGSSEARKEMSASYWRGPFKWNADAEKAGKRRRVFCASMADVFELVPESNVQATAVMREARARLWYAISATPWLDWLLLTKRPQNVKRLAPLEWLEDGFPANVWLGTTAEDAVRAEQRIPHLLALPAAVHFVSYEPALGPVSFAPWLPSTGLRSRTTSDWKAANALDWIIVGGESGPKARPFALEWAERVVDETRGRAACFVKQLGAHVVSEHRTAPLYMLEKDGKLPETLPPYCFAPDGSVWAWRAGLKDAKGGDPSEWPASLCVREFPEPKRIARPAFAKGAPR